LQQLETAIGALRGIVANVASNDALTKLAEEVRALAAKVDGIAASGPTLSTLENRINTLTTALKASTEAGHAVPRELEKLLSGLIEKLEWVQLTHTDHTALAHLEDRIATLVKRLDASDSRLGLLEGVERGLADLLVYIEQLRGAKSEPPGAAGKPVAVDAIEQEVARTQDSLEAVHDTVEHVVDRLAMIESDIRVDRVKAALTEEPLPLEAEESTPPPLPPEPVPMPEADPMFAASIFPAATSTTFAEPEEPMRSEPAPRRAALARAPIDPNLPPDHPLEPGSTVGRSRNGPSAALRIAASEAAIEAKPPVIHDPGGGKRDFIAAARRAAQAAAQDAPYNKSSAVAAARGAPRSKKVTERLRTLMVAAAVVVIVVGGFQIVSRLFEDGGSGTPSQAPTASPPVQTKPSRVEPEAPPLQITRPQVQTETPPAPPAAAPGVAPTNPPAVPAPLSEGDSTQRPDVALPPNSAPQGWHSERDAGGWPPTALADGPSANSPGNAAANGSPLWSTPEVTGSLPRGAAASHNSATAPVSAAADKLPAAIGAPALRAAALAGDASAA
jgi:localization factor PodJL